jgi:hypothetical protein
LLICLERLPYEDVAPALTVGAALFVGRGHVRENTWLYVFNHDRPNEQGTLSADLYDDQKLAANASSWTAAWQEEDQEGSRFDFDNSQRVAAVAVDAFPETSETQAFVRNLFGVVASIIEDFLPNVMRWHRAVVHLGGFEKRYPSRLL